MIDSHCHLQLCREPVEDIAQRALEHGVTELIQVATDVATAKYSIELKHRIQSVRVHPTAGLYPSRAKGGEWPKEIPALEELLKTGDVVAVGEIGIDMYHDQSFLEEQQGMLRAQLELALRYDLPTIFHIRNSFEEVVSVLDEYESHSTKLRGVWHCFEGTLEQALHFVDRGWYISFSGLLTYKKNQWLRDVAVVLPKDRLLIETDSPYLSPVPWRNEKNEPWKVSGVLQCLAEIREESLEELEAQTIANTRTLFRLPMS